MEDNKKFWRSKTILTGATIIMLAVYIQYENLSALFCAAVMFIIGSYWWGRYGG